jgi:primosomal protein N'
MNGKCRYCGAKLSDKSNIRCTTCDNAWQEGAYFGRTEVKEKLREIFNALKNLCGVNQ